MVIGIIGSAIAAFFPELAALAATWIGDLIKYNNSMIDSLFDNAAVIAFFEFTLVIGTFMYLTGILLSVANWVVNKRDGDTPVIDTFKNIFIGFLALNGYISLPVLILKYTNYLCDIMCSGFSQLVLEEQFNDIFSDGIEWGNLYSTSNLLLIIYVIIMLVCVGKLFLANIKRGGILVTLIFVGSFHLISIPRGYTDAFFSWCKQVVGLCITAFVQNFLVALAFLVFSISDLADTTNIIISAGVALAASEVPRILQQFGLDTSMRANVSQAIFAVSGITNIVRAFV